MTTTKHTITVYTHQCRRCGGTWESRDVHPARCSKCKARTWDKPEREYMSIYRVSYGQRYETAGVNEYRSKRVAMRRGVQASRDYQHVVVSEHKSGHSRGVAEWRDRKRVVVDEYWICTIPWPLDGDKEQYWADTNLIAAAPDLLKVAVDLEGFLTGLLGLELTDKLTDPPGGFATGMLFDLRAAIQKATGVTAS